MYNQNYQVNYIANYIYFMKDDGYIHSSSVDYSVFNSLKPKDILSDDFALKHHCESVQYMLSNTLKQYFSKQL